MITGLLILVAFGCSLLYPRYVWYAVLLSLPFSVEMGGSLDVALPAEPLALGFTGANLLRLWLFWDKTSSDSDFSVFRSLVFWLLLAWLCVMGLGVLGAVWKVVAFKKFLFYAVCLFVFYLYPVRLFAQNPTEIGRFFWLYSTGLLAVITYAFVRHSVYGFQPYAAADMPKPFMDHTLYGAVLAFLLPYWVWQWAKNAVGISPLTADTWQKYEVRLPLLTSFALLVWLFAVLTAASRAAWLSLLLAGGVGLWQKLPLRGRLVYAGGMAAVFCIFLYINQTQSVQYQSSSKQSSFGAHFMSFANTETDDSNKERLNRWTAAYDMWQEKPITGWGIGNYIFEYARFQRFYRLTATSTRLADKGGVHNEYLSFLTETGLPGALLYVSLLVWALLRAFRLWRQGRGDAQFWGGLLFFALLTYLFHACFNNFIDQIKLNALLFGTLAVLQGLGRESGIKVD